MTQKHPLQAQSPYSASKIGADKLAESFYRSFDTPVVTLRPFNTYGPRQSACVVIPTIIAQALTRDIIQLGNLEASRDLTYVADTVAGFLRVGQTSGIEGETFNLGSGEDIRIGDLAQKVIALIGRDVRISIDAERLRPEKSEVQRLLSDNSLAREASRLAADDRFRRGVIAYDRLGAPEYKPFPIRSIPGLILHKNRLFGSP